MNPEANDGSLTLPEAVSQAGDPQFSIFIPVWNGSEWLPGAIQSVLDQSYAKWELIIGDNASSDDLESIVNQYRDPRIRYHRWAEHTDIYENFNRTVTLCRYDWLQPLCADDRLNPECLRSMAERIVANENAETRLAAVITAARRVDRDGQPADARFYGVQGRQQIADGLYDGNRWLMSATEPGVQPWNIGSVAIARSVLAEMGSFFRPEAGLCADHELVLRLAAYGSIAFIGDELLDYTVSAESDGNSRSVQERSSGDPVPSMAAALLSALRAHEHRRLVSASERSSVHRAVSHAFLRRSGQHRYAAGGRGRKATMADLLGAVKYNPRMLISPQQVLFALAVMLAPSRWLATGIRRSPQTSWLTRGLEIALPHRIVNRDERGLSSPKRKPNERSRTDP